MLPTMYKANGPPIIIPKVPAKNIIIALLPSFFNAAKLILKVSSTTSQVISNETQWCIDWKTPDMMLKVLKRIK
jgi:hypothetical protein